MSIVFMSSPEIAEGILCTVRAVRPSVRDHTRTKFVNMMSSKHFCTKFTT